MERLLQNASAYEEMLAWKQSGPQDSFLALVDLNAVHSNCRLCIRLADHARALEEAEMQMPPCKCARRAADPVVHHVMVRERSTFEFRDLFLADSELTIAGLHVAMQTAFANHQIGHLQNMVRYGFPIDVTKLPESVRRHLDAALAARKAEG